MKPCLPESKCHGSVAADIGGIVSGDAPQLDSTSSPWMWTWEEVLVDLKAALRGAIWLNCTLDRQPVNPGVLYLYISWSIFPISTGNQETKRYRKTIHCFGKHGLSTQFRAQFQSLCFRRLRMFQTLSDFFPFCYRLKQETFKPCWDTALVCYH